MNTEQRHLWYRKGNSVKQKETKNWTDNALVILFFIFLVSIGLITG